MKNFILIIQNEWKHFARSPFKTISLILFMVAAVYGLQNGYTLYKKQNAEIATINVKNNESIQKTLTWFNEGKTGPEDRPMVDITKPFWAVSYATTSAIKKPSVLMPFSIGQTEQFGYYKQVTQRSIIYDSYFTEEIANPERLAIGTLDYSFVVLYLLPVLAIVLLFNIGGMEKDLGFYRLIEVNTVSQKKWLLARFTFYFVLLLALLLLVMLPYVLLTEAFKSEATTFLKLVLYIVLYVFIWFAFFYFINLLGKGSANQALKMIAVWLLFCIVVPGSIHQWVSTKYPVNYMTEYIDLSRNEGRRIRNLPTDSVVNQLLKLYPQLANTKHGKDTVADKAIVGNSMPALFNKTMKYASAQVENTNQNKNHLIEQTFFINPVGFFQNKMNSLANNDYYAYRRFRTDIQTMIDKKINVILFDGWNKESVNKKKYLQYIEKFKN